MYNILMKLDEIEARISFLGELVSINSPISLWSFDNNGTLYWTNSASLTYNLIFTNSDSFSYMKKYFEEGNRKPIILSNHSGLIWGATAYFSEDKLQSYHVAGPILTQVKSDEALRKEISKKTNNSFSMDKMVKAIQSLPIMSINSFLSILLMLHYTVEGEKLSTSDVMMQHPEEAKDDTLTPLSNNQNDRLIIYHSEKTILDMIRNGHLDKKEATKAASAFTGTQMYSENSLQHAKLSRALFVGQAAKAAIEGGISTDLAYTRQDMYMRDLDSAKSISEINRISFSMLNDFVDLVHKAKTESSRSLPVQFCCDYISSHVEDPITIALLASKAGYSDYYLSRKFREEVGMGIDDFIKEKKIEKAKVLLSSTHIPIYEISEKLSFGTRNYFSEIFRKTTGLTPLEYRKKNQHY